MSTFCQRLYHRKCHHRRIGGQKSPNLVNVVCERPPTVLVACCRYKYLLTVFYARMYYIDTPLAMTQIVVLENFSLFSNANLNALVIIYNIPTCTIQISQMCNSEYPIFLDQSYYQLIFNDMWEKKIPRILQDII